MKSPVLKWLLGYNYCETTDPPPFINGSAHHSGSVEEPLGGQFGPAQGSGWGKKATQPLCDKWPKMPHKPKRSPITQNATCDYTDSWIVKGLRCGGGGAAAAEDDSGGEEEGKKQPLLQF